MCFNLTVFLVKNSQNIPSLEQIHKKTNINLLTSLDEFNLVSFLLFIDFSATFDQFGFLDNLKDFSDSFPSVFHIVVL